MNFVRISRASDNHPQKNTCVFKISVFSVRSVVEIKPETGDTTKLCATPVGFNWYNRIVLPGFTPRPVIFHAFGVFFAFCAFVCINSGSIWICLVMAKNVEIGVQKTSQSKF